jgi:hypothetical protein
LQIFPKNLKRLHGFLGLVGHCKKFVKNYGKIITTLTSLLKKNAFVWNKTIEEAILALKESMCTILVLELPNLTKIFVLEYDVMHRGVRSLLIQEGHSMAFTGKKLCYRNLVKSTYEKEIMAILHTFDTWYPYLIGRHF